MKVVIAGGTGMVGTDLTKSLLDLGHEVIILSRKARKSADQNLSYSKWNLNERKLDEDLIKSSDAIINLSGASIAQRWTAKARKEIMESRTVSTSLLSNLAISEGSMVKTFINASAIGYYEPGYEPRVEDDPAGDHFMAKVCKAWEDSVHIPEDSSVRKVILRIGVVLEKDGGALKAMSFPFKLGLGAPLGSGKQYMSIVHADDLVNIFMFCLQNHGIAGTFNAVMPENPTNKEFSKNLAQSMGKPFFLPPVPAFALRLVMGETAESVLQSFNVSSEKLEKNGFQFEYSDSVSALQKIYSSRE